MSNEPNVALIEGPAELSLVDEVLDALERLLEACPAGTPDDRNFFMLAVSEVVTNVVQHGPDVPQPFVRVAVWAGPASFDATVSDDAPPAVISWDEEPSDALSESGRGLDMARAVLSEFTHDATGEGNVWRLSRRLGEPTDTAG